MLPVYLMVSVEQPDDGPVAGPKRVVECTELRKLLESNTQPIKLKV